MQRTGIFYFVLKGLAPALSLLSSSSLCAATVTVKAVKVPAYLRVPEPTAVPESKRIPESIPDSESKRGPISPGPKVSGYPGQVNQEKKVSGYLGLGGGDIRVRIAEGVPRVVVRGFDLRIYDTQKWGLRLVGSTDKTSEWEFRCQDGVIRAMPLYSPGKKEVLELNEPVSIQTPVGFLHFGDHPYRNELRIYSSGILCDAINHVELEKYLDGLVNSEFSSKWNEESIAAQVVVARTYAYHQILENKKKKTSHFDVDATVKDQVYDGSMREDFHSSRVAEKTRGMVLLVGTGDHALPIKAFYHSTCGGMTELPEHVWGVSYPGFKRPVACPFCAQSPRYNWDLDLTVAEVARAILKGVKNEKFENRGDSLAWPKNAISVVEQGRLLDFRVKLSDSVGRVAILTTVWADGKRLVELPVTGAEFRNWIGVSRFKSTAFQAYLHRSKSDEKGYSSSWHFYGKGNGHGVGLCQWGAKAMGEKGYKMPEILTYYYPDAILRKMW